MIRPVIVLGKKLNNGQPSKIYQARLRSAASHVQDLTRGGLEWRLIISGGVVNGNNVSEAEAGFEFLLAEYPQTFRQDMENNDVFLDLEAKDTVGNVVYPIDHYIDITSNGGQLDIATSDYHLERALGVFGYLLDLPKAQLGGIGSDGLNPEDHARHMASEAKKRELTQSIMEKEGINRGQYQKATDLLRRNNGFIILDDT